MTTRREFIRDTAGALAGITFTGCGLLGTSRAQAQSKPAVRRREVVINGRRVKTIDVHSHCEIPEAMALTGRKLGDAVKGQREMTIVVQDRLRAMDEQGIDIEALSINPSWYRAERELVTQVIKIQNEKLAELCAAHPDRFVAFASLALQFPELAAQQLEEAVKKLGLRGAAIGGHVNGDELSNPKFNPFWAKAEELGVLIFMHPQGVPELDKRLAG